MNQTSLDDNPELPCIARMGEILIFGNGPRYNTSYYSILGPFTVIKDIGNDALRLYMQSDAAQALDNSMSRAREESASLRNLLTNVEERLKSSLLFGNPSAEPFAAGFISWLEENAFIQRLAVRVVPVISSVGRNPDGSMTGNGLVCDDENGNIVRASTFLR